jgi:transposase-like protein
MPIANKPLDALGSMEKMVCPKCGYEQARTRKPKVDRYQCFNCLEYFTIIEGRSSQRTDSKPNSRRRPVL